MSRISAVSRFDYWERSSKLKLTSLQRRREFSSSSGCLDVGWVRFPMIWELSYVNPGDLGSKQTCRHCQEVQPSSSSKIQRVVCGNRPKAVECFAGVHICDGLSPDIQESSY